MNNSFVFYNDWIDMIEELDDESRGKLLLAIMRYQNGGEIPDMDIGARVAFAQIKKQFQKDKEKYEETVNARREAGKLGGRPKANGFSEKQTKAKKANGFSEKQTKAKKPDNDNVNDNDNDKEKENAPTEHERKSAPRFIPPTAEQVRDYCKERNNSVNAEQFVDFYTSKGWKVGKETMKDWKAAVRTWEKRENWNASQVKKKNTFSSFQQNNYDFAELEQALEGS